MIGKVTTFDKVTFVFAITGLFELQQTNQLGVPHRDITVEMHQTCLNSTDITVEMHQTCLNSTSRVGSGQLH
jgi:hypothetical protein